jgi:enterochelin esterase-like enzyme
VNHFGLPPQRRRLARRAILGGAVAWATGCRRRSDEARNEEQTRSPPGVPSESLPEPLPPAPSAKRVADAALLEMLLDFPETPVGPEKALVVVPRRGDATARYPVLVALHGRGESVRGIEVGARGWMDDYDLGRAMARLWSPPLLREDFRGFVDDARLAHLNASLIARPFRGLVVACPWVPDILSSRDRANLDASLSFGSFVVDHLMPRVVAETPASAERAATGIDGVSLGGRASLVVGFAHADRFGAIGTLQAALQDSEAAAFAARARAALQHGPLHVRLVTSDRDPFAGAITQLHLAFDEGRIDHEYLVIPGPHDYAFNRGPGGIEMLLWHDRILRGEPAL